MEELFVLSQPLFVADGGPSACQSQIDANSKRTQPCPRGSGQRSWTQRLAKPDQGGKQEANGGKLAFIRAVQAFTCHGGGGSAAFQFYQLGFYVARSLLWYFPCTPRATALRQARVSGGNLQNCAPSAACGGAMTQESTVFLVPLVPLPPVLAAVLGNLLHFFMLGGQLRRAVGFRRQRLIALP